MKECVIVGAGMAGLVAARRLSELGITPIVLDKGRGVGGRMATRRGDQASFDHGAQAWLDPEPRVVAWLEIDALVQWTKELGYRGKSGMASIAKSLARGLDVRVKHKVESIAQDSQGWKVTIDDGAILSGNALILTAPFAQSLDLITTSGIDLPANKVGNSIAYERCLVVMAAMPRSPSDWEHPPRSFDPGEPVRWVADNIAKGISHEDRGSVALTIFAGPEFSVEHWDHEPRFWTERLLEGAGCTPDQVSQSRVDHHRWRYSQAVGRYPVACLALETNHPLVLAGDGFGGDGPGLNQAAASGYAAAEVIADRLS